MTLRLVANPTYSPLVVDEAGHLLGGREFGTVDSRDPISRVLLSAGLLIEKDLPADDADLRELSPAFVDATARHRERADRTEKASQLDKPALAELVDADPSEPKRDLVEQVATSTAEIPDTRGGRGRRPQKEN